MQFDRRFVLKALAVSPASLLASSTLSMSGCSPGCVDIYLFGLFLMEFQGDNLVLVTPQYDCHKFCVVYSDKWADMPEYVNYWDRLKAGTTSSFNPHNLKFPASAIRDTGFVLDPSSPTHRKHRCTMMLPWPESIEVGHVQRYNDFHPCPKSNIGTLIKQEANSQDLGSITRLRYKSKDGTCWTEWYAVMHNPLTLETVNRGLAAARTACGDSPYGERFDLQMERLGTNDMPDPTRCPTAKELSDLFAKNTGGGKDVDVASCPQFGIHRP
jgi:hypothetical protein